MSITLKIVAAGAFLVLALAGGAIVKNRVPLTEPPGLVHRLLLYLSANSARTRIDHELAELRTRVAPHPPARTLELVARAAESAGWQVTTVDSGRHELHAVVSTPLLGFRDDVRVSLSATGTDASLVQVESQSRVGRADFGANLAHIMELYRRLEALADLEVAEPEG